MTKRLTWLWVVGVMILAGVWCQAQQNATGTQAFGSFSGGPDIINLGNLDVNLVIPILQRQGRGIPFVFDLTYDSSLVWSPVTTGSSTTWTPQAGWGWPVPVSAAGYIPSPVVFSSTVLCSYPSDYATTTWRIYPGYSDVHGTMHHVPNLTTSTISAPPACGGNSFTDATAATDDGSGYSITILHGLVSTASLISKGGKAITVPIGHGTATLAIDSNGNEITANSSTGQFFDTLSSTTPVLTVTGTSPSPVDYTYTAPGSAGTGTSVSVVVSYKEYAVQTHFLCSGVTDYGASVPINNYLVDKITYPDGSFYQFAYEPTITGSGYVTGRIASVTFPTGGTISYTYTGSNGGINCADGTTMGFKRITPDSSTPWQYSRSGSNPNWITTVTDPLNNVTTYNMYQVTSTSTAGSASQSTYTYYERNRTVGTLETILTCYNAVYSACTTNTLALPFSQVDQYVTLGSKTSATETKYDTSYGGRVTEVKQYDFGVSTGSAPSPSLLLKATIISYATLTDIIDHPYQVTIEDGSGNIKAQTTYSYSDAVTATSGTPQQTSPSGSRGNAVTVASLTSGSSTLSKTFTYFDTGNVKVATDVNGAQTTYTYGACGNSFTTEIQLPLSFTQYFGWDNSNTCVGAVMTSSKDVNGNPTNFTFTDPYYWRPAQISYPDGGSTSYTYNTGSSTPWTVEQSVLVSTGNNATTTSYLDGLGRTYSVYRSDPNSNTGYNYVNISRDPLGHVSAVSNPFFHTGDPTYGITYYNYDALGRNATVNTTHAITFPDGTTEDIQYTSRAELVTDASGIQKAYQIDGLGRLQYTCDGIGAVSQASGATASSCGLDVTASGFLATYGYDALGNLTSANIGQSSSSSGQSRSYTFDGLSRLLTENNPETGATTYVYDTGTGGDLYTKTTPAPNQTSACVGTIATCNTQTYEFDPLHRLKEILNSSGVGLVGYVYDEPAPPTGWPSATLNNTKGRLSWTSVTAGWDAVYSYDTMGRVTDNWQCTPTNCAAPTWHATYTYNYIGQPTFYTDPNGTMFAYYRNAIGQLTQENSHWVDPTHPQVLFTGATYNALGQLTYGTFGDGTARSVSYNSMGRLTAIQDGPNTCVIYCLTLGYAPNGSVSGDTDSSNGEWSFTYDAFNRLATSTCTFNCPGSGNSEAYTYSYDQFGNRWKQHLTAGTGYEVDYTFDTTAPSTSHNRNITSGFAYDAAGNLTSDGTCTPCWTYDDLDQLVSGNGATYTFNALGGRVQTIYGGYTHDFTVGLGGTPDVEYSGSSYVGSSGQGFFTYRNNTTYFHKTDHLGTPHVSTDYTGTIQRTESNLPFGDAFSQTSSPFVDYTGFAGGVWDISNASDTDHFGARDYAKTQGRWLHPDPAGLAAVDPTNPQTWNRYAYVGNNPVSYNDPSGLKRPIWSGLPGGSGGYVGIFAQMGWNAISSAASSLVNGLVSTGAAVFCSQCAPGTPGGPTLVGQGNPGSNNQPVWVPGGCAGSVGDTPNCVGPSWMTQQQLADSAVNSSSLPNGDIPVNPNAQAVFSNPKLQTAASTMTDPRTMALWYGMAAAPQAPEIYTAASEFWTSVEIAFPGATAATADVLQMLTPPSSVPSTDWGLAVILGDQAYDWYQQQ